eukprot:GHVS01088886.1.p1 GENE.GHVS01088886.1~~GHVS01088886.1.p1  ORF type:complete len:260 (-),score=53.51 GHVS01088886.1:297-1076(-)
MKVVPTGGCCHHRVVLLRTTTTNRLLSVMVLSALMFVVYVMIPVVVVAAEVAATKVVVARDEEQRQNNVNTNSIRQTDSCNSTNYSFTDGLGLCVCHKLQKTGQQQPEQTFCACKCDQCGGFGLTGCEECEELSGVCTNCNCIRPNPARNDVHDENNNNRAEPLCHESGYIQTDLSNCRCNNRGGLTICACLCDTCTSIPVQACMQCDEQTCQNCRCGGTGFGGRLGQELFDGFLEETNQLLQTAAEAAAVDSAETTTT